MCRSRREREREGRAKVNPLGATLLHFGYLQFYMQDDSRSLCYPWLKAPPLTDFKSAATAAMFTPLVTVTIYP